MNKISVECKVKTYNPKLTKEYLIITSDRIYEDSVSLKFGDKLINVVGKDLVKAIEKCMNA